MTTGKTDPLWISSSPPPPSSLLPAELPGLDRSGFFLPGGPGPGGPGPDGPGPDGPGAPRAAAAAFISALYHSNQNDQWSNFDQWSKSDPRPNGTHAAEQWPQYDQCSNQSQGDPLYGTRASSQNLTSGQNWTSGQKLPGARIGDPGLTTLLRLHGLSESAPLAAALQALAGQSLLPVCPPCQRVS